MTTASHRFTIRKWAGLWMGALAWFADQQIVATTAYARCPSHSARLVITVGVICALVALTGVWLSLSARKIAADSGPDRFIATVSALLACISLLAILFGTSAGLFLQCER